MDKFQDSAATGAVKRPTDLSYPPVEVTAAPSAAAVVRLVLSVVILGVLAVAACAVALAFGLGGLWRVVVVVAGFSLILLIHVFGHFVAAKLCGVQVKTLSVGIGPALPWCRRQWGETVYQLAAIPLGGYVRLAGKGFGGRADKDNPRSFRNRSFVRCLVILLAGIFANLLFGWLAFAVFYWCEGWPRTPMNIGHTEAGGPAWKLGVRSGSHVDQFGPVANPSFEELKAKVLLSEAGEQFSLRTRKRAEGVGGDFEGLIQPRRDRYDSSPVVGITPAQQLTLLEQRMQKWRTLPVGYHSAAAAARVLDLEPGAVVVAATDPDNPFETSLVRGGWRETAERMRKLDDKPLVLRIVPKGAAAAGEKEIKVAPVGFQWDDVIVGATDPQQQDDAYDPFVVKELPPDQTNTQKKVHDYFAFRQRMKLLAGKPVVVQVRRKGDADGGKPVSIFVPPQYHRALGLRMRMGEVVAVRDKSPAAAAGLQPGDIIGRVEMMVKRPAAGNAGAGVTVLGELVDSDPAKLPFELTRLASGAPGQKYVSLTFSRPKVPADVEDDRLASVIALREIPWEENWTFDEEHPSPSQAALAIPQLGIAYRIDTTIAAVAPGSLADQAGLQVNDQLTAVAFRQSAEKRETVAWGNWINLEAPRGEQACFDRWAYVDYELQFADDPQLHVKYRRGGSSREAALQLTAEEDATWPEAERGLLLSPDLRVEKGDSVWQALGWGLSRTGEFYVQNYRGIRGLITSRLSSDVAQGPADVGRMGYDTADSPFSFLALLGLLSLTLVIWNLLPLPFLDGGSIVFLIFHRLIGILSTRSLKRVPG